jgi:hypothetical protein
MGEGKGGERGKKGGFVDMMVRIRTVRGNVVDRRESKEKILNFSCCTANFAV